LVYRNYVRPLDNRRFCSLTRKSVFENHSVLKYVRIAKNDLTQFREKKSDYTEVFTWESYLYNARVRGVIATYF